jgi:hypothetical protein
MTERYAHHNKILWHDLFTWFRDAAQVERVFFYLSTLDTSQLVIDSLWPVGFFLCHFFNETKIEL